MKPMMGRAFLDAGFKGVRTRLPRGLAWLEGYAIGLLAECEADYGRLLAAAEELRGKIREARRKWAAETPERPERSRVPSSTARLISASAEWS
jgi:hypothetical protein